MSGLVASSAGLDVRRRRILFRCWHRGIRELDLILGRFAEVEIASLAEADLDALERLLEEADGEVLGWVLQQTAAPAQHETELLRRLKNVDCRHGAPG